jgi:hypothetical protein
MNFGYINAEYENKASLLAEQWEQQGLLKGIDKDISRFGLSPNHPRAKAIRKNTAVMLENQANYNEQAANITGSDDIAAFRRISIPMVRRAFPTMVAHHLIGIQPMIGPQTLVYYIRYRAGITKGNQVGTGGPDGAGDVKWPNAGWDNTSLQQKADGTVALPRWFTHQRVHLETRASAGAGVNKTFALGFIPVVQNGIVASPSDAALNPAITAGTAYTAFGVIAVANINIAYFRIVDTAVTIVGIAGAAFVVNAATFNADTGIITATMGADPDGAGATIIRNLVYAYNMECNTNLPTVNVVVESQTVTAMTRKLRFQWSNEAQMDVKTQHNIDLESDFMQFGATEIALETDREILEDLRDNSGSVVVWDFATALGDTIKERYESLFVKMVECSNQIRKKTLRAEANFVVCSPEVYAIFASATAGFAPAPMDGFQSAVGIQYVGTINSRYRVFVDPDAPRDQILMGYRGDGMETGYFLCPYVAMMQSELLVDPLSGCLSKILMTRYGKTLLRDGARYYGRIQITNFF